MRPIDIRNISIRFPIGYYQNSISGELEIFKSLRSTNDEYIETSDARFDNLSSFCRLLNLQNHIEIWMTTDNFWRSRVVNIFMY